MSTLNFRPRVPVFDANIGVGHRHDRPAPFAGPEQLLKEMTRHGVERAVIYQVQGEQISALDGNALLRDWAADHSAFSLQWVASAGPNSLAQLQQLDAAAPIASVRLHDTQAANAPFTDWLYGDLLTWLSQQRIPLWISLADTPAAEIITTLARFPDLTTVLLGAHYTHSLFVEPLLQNLPNAHLELSRFENLDGITRLIHAFGNQRFLYGSYYPRYAMGAMLFYLHHIGLDDDQLAAVCAGNLTRLLERQAP
ncbi:MAG: hypothetical protein GKR89_26585 [Candidatus Latescibacteria bacterium]|nr:hypothetical protein [Candidatus Latescibacterota bacterium]